MAATGFERVAYEKDAATAVSRLIYVLLRISVIVVFPIWNTLIMGCHVPNFRPKLSRNTEWRM